MTYKLKNKIYNNITYSRNIKNLINSFVLPNYKRDQNRVKKLCMDELNKLSANTILLGKKSLDLGRRHGSKLLHKVVHGNCTPQRRSIYSPYRWLTPKSKHYKKGVDCGPLTYKTKIPPEKIKRLLIRRKICYRKLTSRGTILYDNFEEGCLKF